MKILTKNEILKRKKPIPKKKKYGGVYFLIDDNEIVYVGKSADYIDRILSHRISLCEHCDKVKKFDSYTVIKTDDNDSLRTIESIYIAKFKPLHNIKNPFKKYIS
jgi:excinuclease UvrABC nuclease subunit